MMKPSTHTWKTCIGQQHTYMDISYTHAPSDPRVLKLFTEEEKRQLATDVNRSRQFT